MTAADAPGGLAQRSEVGGDGRRAASGSGSRRPVGAGAAGGSRTLAESRVCVQSADVNRRPKASGRRPIPEERRQRPAPGASETAVRSETARPGGSSQFSRRRRISAQIARYLIDGAPSIRPGAASPGGDSPQAASCLPGRPGAAQAGRRLPPEGEISLKKTFNSKKSAVHR